VRQQKTDRRDAAHILKLLMERRFPRLWRPDAEARDLCQLLIHRHRLVQIRTRVKNVLQRVRAELVPDSWLPACHAETGSPGRGAVQEVSTPLPS